MSITIYRSVVCDRCGATTKPVDEPERLIITVAAGIGWDFTDWTHSLCPSCATPTGEETT